MFAVGGVLSIWEGVSRLHRPEAVKSPLWNYVVLATSVSISAISFVIALREIYRRKGDSGIFEFIHRSKDPTVFTVLLEDASDILGESLAFVAIFLSVKLHNPIFDGIGSILIGFVILSASGILANESRELLIGETAPSKHVERMKQLLASDPAVERVGDLLTMQLGPYDVLVNVEIQFQRQSCVEDLEQTIARLEQRVRSEFPEVHHLFVEVAFLRNQQQNLPQAS